MRSIRAKHITIAWSCFLLKVVGIWLAKDELEKRKRNYTLSYTVGVIIVAMCIALRDIYFSWGNFSLWKMMCQFTCCIIRLAIFSHRCTITVALIFLEFILFKFQDCVYIICNISYLLIVFVKIFTVYAHRTKFHELIIFTQKNFWHEDYNSEEKMIVKNCEVISTIFIVIISFCAQGTCAGYLMTPIIANMGRNQSDRILPFNMWVEFPTGLSPYFEVLFTIQILCVYHVGVGYICLDNFLCLLCLQIASQFRILQHRFQNLNRATRKAIADYETGKIPENCPISSYIELNNCVQLHQVLTDYCKKLEEIFSLMVLGQVLFVAMVLCLVGYQLFLADIPPSRDASLGLNFFGTLCQLLMFTYSCDGLIRESANVGKAIFSSPWIIMPMDKVGKHVRQNVIIVIMRSNKHCYLTAGRFFPISLETYTGVLSTAMSYFTLLRQSSMELMDS